MRISPLLRYDGSGFCRAVSYFYVPTTNWDLIITCHPLYLLNRHHLPNKSAVVVHAVDINFPSVGVKAASHTPILVLHPYRKESPPPLHWFPLWGSYIFRSVNVYYWITYLYLTLRTFVELLVSTSEYTVLFPHWAASYFSTVDLNLKRTCSLRLSCVGCECEGWMTVVATCALTTLSNFKWMVEVHIFLLIIYVEFFQ